MHSFNDDRLLSIYILLDELNQVFLHNFALYFIPFDESFSLINNFTLFIDRCNNISTLVGTEK